MSSKKNKGNNNRSLSSAKPVQPKVASEAELTSEEKERLKKEGEEKKAALIAEGEAEKTRLIREGETKKEKIIADAEQEAKESKEEIQEQFREEVRKEAEEEAAAIREEAQKEKDELDGKLGDVQKQYDELAQKQEQFVSDSAALEAKKLTYKTDVLDEIKKRTGNVTEEIDRLESEKAALEKQLKVKERELASCTDDKDYYADKLKESEVRKQTVTELESKVKTLEQANSGLNQALQTCQQEKEKLEAQVNKFGEDPTILMGKITRLETDNEMLRDKLAKLPEEEEIESLRRDRESYERARAELFQLKQEKSEADEKSQNLAIYESDLENSRRFIRILELQRLELQRELDRIMENYNARRQNVFATLSAIDKEPVGKPYPNSGRKLSEICSQFRSYLATRSENPLYYSEMHIRTFFAGLAASRILILQGMSGTGKSSLPAAFADFMESVTDRIEVQSSWKDRNDLLGFYNDFEKRYKETKFLEALYRATRDPDNIHLIVLDEMNLSRIEYYFADFLSVLEEEKIEKWRVSLVSRDVMGDMPEYVTDGELQVRPNTWFIGTANKDDSTFMITDKVYDRAIVLNFEERTEEFDAKYSAPRGLSYSELEGLLREAVILPRDMKDKIKKKVEWLDDLMKVHFDITFGNRISRQIEKFVPAYMKCGGKLEEAIDIIFATKVLRKLQGLYDESTKNALNEFSSELKNDKEFGDKLTVTKNTIQKMIDRM